MTALAIALVLCCAMVCVTVVVCRRDAGRQSEEEHVSRMFQTQADWNAANSSRVDKLRQDVDNLNAMAATKDVFR